MFYGGVEEGDKKQLQGPTCLEMLQTTFSLESFSAHYIKAMESLPAEKPAKLFSSKVDLEFHYPTELRNTY